MPERSGYPMEAPFSHPSESVSRGHPDKVSDQISDGLLDEYLRQDPSSRVAIETLVTTDFVIVAGEVTSQARVDIESVVRGIIKHIGYDRDGIGFNGNTVEFISKIHTQSPDIAMGVDRDGAGDQGLMFGYASNQTQELMPLPISLAQRLTRRLTELREGHTHNWLLPDGKSQVVVRYQEDKSQELLNVVVSTHHTDEITQPDLHDAIREDVIKPVCGRYMTDETTLYINPTGRFLVGGPHGDTGVTGRKIIVDSYGGWGRHGGGAFSGKDPTKVDRSAAYMARHVAKNVVAADLADECEIALAYAIGVAEPLAVNVETFGTEKYDKKKIIAAIQARFPLTPKGIITHLGLRNPIYFKTAYDGHFGRNDVPWEDTSASHELYELVNNT